jgi:hypothetical protein
VTLLKKFEEMEWTSRVPIGFRKDSRRTGVMNDMKRLGLSLTNCRINADYTVDTITNVTIVSDVETCPIRFSVANGSFTWRQGNLKNLTNFPKIVMGDCVVSNNKLVSLYGSPRQVGGNFICSYNPILV